MGVRKVLEAVCDNCGAGIDYFWGLTIPKAKQVIRDMGGVVQHDKTFCNQECCDAWWRKKTSGQIK